MKAGGNCFKLPFQTTEEDHEEEDTTILWVMTAAKEIQVKAAKELDGIFAVNAI